VDMAWLGQYEHGDSGGDSSGDSRRTGRSVDRMLANGWL